MKYLYRGHEGDTLLELVRNAQQYCAVNNLPKTVGGRYWKFVIPELLYPELRQELQGRIRVPGETVFDHNFLGLLELCKKHVNFDEGFIAVLDEMFVCFEEDPG